ncbi:hypothetical protein CLI64_03650 [Nostoc sp. CENA543]|uniref:hypothetical protein n=1 Tax=Nostoc sp. CENA543 TaxID=1869241 RepID=UPI000CA29F4B|nr:hypothetical protein [Nostoc sp. CENA543]AUS99552.1 hypothetical protein CLI64_03650 [Nostoc sp. CENA543]
MLTIKNRINQWQHKITLVMLIGLIWLLGLPTNSVNAAGYYSARDHKTELATPYYTHQQRRIGYTEPTSPYYKAKNRKHITRNSDEYLEGGNQSREVTPQELGRIKQQKHSISRQ